MNPCSCCLPLNPLWTTAARRVVGRAACLSRLPWDLPTGIHRSDYKNFCIACSEWDQGGPAVPCCIPSSKHLQRGMAKDRIPAEIVLRYPWVELEGRKAETRHCTGTTHPLGNHRSA